MCRVVDESEVQTTQPDEAGNMYMLVQENLSWEDARDACQNAGGQLAEVRSAGEEDQIKGLLTGMGVTQAWLCNEVQNGANHGWGDSSYTPGTYSNWGSDVQLGRAGESAYYEGVDKIDHDILDGNCASVHTECDCQPPSRKSCSCRANPEPAWNSCTGDFNDQVLEDPECFCQRCPAGLRVRQDATEYVEITGAALSTCFVNLSLLVAFIIPARVPALCVARVCVLSSQRPIYLTFCVLLHSLRSDTTPVINRDYCVISEQVYDGPMCGFMRNRRVYEPTDRPTWVDDWGAEQCGQQMPYVCNLNPAQDFNPHCADLRTHGYTLRARPTGDRKNLALIIGLTVAGLVFAAIWIYKICHSDPRRSEGVPPDDVGKYEVDRRRRQALERRLDGP
jgi:hypothetical protein